MSQCNVKIIAADHVFKQSTTTLGAQGRKYLSSDPETIKLPLPASNETYAGLIDDICILYFNSDHQTFRIYFQAKTIESATAWCNELNNDLGFYCSVFLYVFNRYRASDAIAQAEEDQRQFLKSLNESLRQPSGPSNALSQLANRANYEWLVVLVFSQFEQYLVPIACSEASLLPKLREVPLNGLQFKAVFFERDLDFLKIPNFPQSAKLDCNCRVFYDMSARSAAFVPFGREIEGGRPRGVISFYSREQRDPQERELLLFRLGAREIAGWVNENDEIIELKIVENSIQSAERRCKTEEIDFRVLNDLLLDIEHELQSALSLFPSVPVSSLTVNIGLLIGNAVVGRIPRQLTSHARSMESSGLLESENDCYAVVWREAKAPLIMIIHAHRRQLGLLRSRVFASLYRVLNLVYQLVSIEERRTHWTLQTFHELRQPLQGIVAIAHEIRRLGRTASEPRSKIVHWVEDMESGILILTVLLRYSEHLADLLHVIPNPREIKIEADVLRPIRRHLRRLAARNNLKISDTIGYELIPPIISDSELLAMIFFNLIQNAIKYSPPQTEIKISCGVEGDEYYIDIENLGPEIHIDEQEAIFQEGYRGREVRDKGPAGLGIGLFIAKAIAETLNCRLELKSRGANQKPVVLRLCIQKESRT